MDGFRGCDVGGRVLVVLVGVVNMNVAGSRCPVVARSCGMLMGVWWTKMGPWVELAVPDMVGVVNVVPFGSDVTPEGGGSAGTVVLVGGCDTLMLYITSLVAGVGALWGASRVVWSSTTLLVMCSSLCASPSSSNSGTLFMWLALAILCSTRLPPSSTLPLDLSLISCVPWLTSSLALFPAVVVSCIVSSTIGVAAGLVGMGAIGT